jgi:plastocyanin
MTWLWRIFFSSLWLLPAVAATVSGTVELVDSRDPAVRRTKNFSSVVVWLDPPAGEAPLKSGPRRVEMVQRGKHFLPHVLAIQVGTTVDFPNFDPIFHNAFSNFSGQLFDVGLYAPGTSRSERFKREGVVRVFCNIHPTMSAVIVVLRTPYFAVSNRSGAFTIADVPPGEYRLRVFHERASEEKLQTLERAVTVETSDLKLPVLTISETGYLPAPHKNKYGKEYPAVIDDRMVYPGARK